MMGPLGNGFTLPASDIIVAGGGIGVPPLLFAAQSVKNRVTAILGFRSARQVILEDGFAGVCDKVYITTDDGSRGISGTVIKPLEEMLAAGWTGAVLSCGPFLMQKAVAEACASSGVPCQVSMEERMGCGTGACLVCACATVINGNEQMSRVCLDGPVFKAEEVIWQI